MAENLLNKQGVIYEKIDANKNKEFCEEYDIKLKNILAEMRRNLATGHIPGIRKGQKCSGCSMKDLCMPSIKPVKDLQAEIEKIGKAEL